MDPEVDLRERRQIRAGRARAVRIVFAFQRRVKEDLAQRIIVAQVFLLSLRSVPRAVATGSFPSDLERCGLLKPRVAIASGTDRGATCPKSTPFPRRCLTELRISNSEEFRKRLGGVGG